jgi:hypothetical protein
MFKKSLVLCLVCLIAVSAATALFAQQPPTKTLYVSLTTRTMQMPRIPGLPAGMKIPGMDGAATRSVSGRAVYAVKPVEPIYVTVPTDLKLPNNRLVLSVPKSTPGEAEEGEEAPGQPGQPGSMQMVSKLYWHPDVAKGPVTETVKMQQPKGRGPAAGMGAPNLDFGLLDLNKEASGSESRIPPAAKGQGNYLCNTGGTATLDGFLPALNVTEPALESTNPNAGFNVKWAPVPGARGYLVAIMAMKNEGDENNMKMTITSWYSTLVQPPARVRSSYQQATTIADDLRDGILLPGDTTSVKVPAGMFPEFDMFTLRVEAIGNDFYSNAGPTVFGTIRSEWTANKMNFGAMGGDDEE